MNTFSIEYQKYKDSELAKRLELKYSEKPYYQRFTIIRPLTLVSSYLFNLFSLLTASTLVYFFTYDLSGSVYPSIAVTVVFLLMLEVFKRNIGSLYFKEALQYQRHNTPLMLFGTALLILSVSFSYYGSKKLVTSFVPSAEIVSPQDQTSPLQLQITDIDNQIAQARKTQWRGTTTSTSQKTIESLTKSKLLLQERLIQIDTKTEQANDIIKQEHKADTKYKAEYFAVLTLILELCFFLCCYYLEYYDHRSYSEFNRGALNSLHPLKSEPTFFKSESSDNHQDIAGCNFAAGMDSEPSKNGIKSTPLSIAERKLATSEFKIERSDNHQVNEVKPTPVGDRSLLSTIDRSGASTVAAIKKVKPKKLSRACQHCSKDISHKRKDAKYCDADCRKKAWAKS